MTNTPDMRLVPVPFHVLSEAAAILDCEGYGPISSQLNALLEAAPQPADLRERVARASVGAILEQDGYSADGAYLNDDLTIDYLDQGRVDFGKVADAILALLQPSPVEQKDGAG